MALERASGCQNGKDWKEERKIRKALRGGKERQGETWKKGSEKERKERGKKERRQEKERNSKGNRKEKRKEEKKDCREERRDMVGRERVKENNQQKL